MKNNKNKKRCIYIGPSFVVDWKHFPNKKNKNKKYGICYYSYGLTGYTDNNEAFYPDDKNLNWFTVCRWYDLYYPSL